MVEDFVYQYVFSQANYAGAIAFGLSVAGAIIAAVFHRSKALLSRSPYFALTGLIFLFATSVDVIWLMALSAMEAGYLWLIVLIDVVSGVLAGYVFFVVAMARSRSAFGHSRWAFLGFIPLVNLALVFAEPKRDNTRRSFSFAAVGSTLGNIVVGLLCFAGAAVIGFGLENSASQAVETNEVSEETQIQLLQRQMKSQGLEETLRILASEVSSYRVDDLTYLQGVYADRRKLRYAYLVDESVEKLPPTMEAQIIYNTCSEQFLRAILEAGGIIEYRYAGRDNKELLFVDVAKLDCE